MLRELHYSSAAILVGYFGLFKSGYPYRGHCLFCNQRRAKVSEKAEKNAKEQVSAEFCSKISENSMQLVENTINGAMENFDKIRDIISNSMDVEIREMQRQLESIICDMEQGEEVIQQKSAQLAESEKELKAAADRLDTFIFELLK